MTSGNHAGHRDAQSLYLDVIYLWAELARIERMTRL